MNKERQPVRCKNIIRFYYSLIGVENIHNFLSFKNISELENDILSNRYEKIKDFTQYILTYSPTFKRDVASLFSTENDEEIKKKQVRYILLHLYYAYIRTQISKREQCVYFTEYTGDVSFLNL